MPINVTPKPGKTGCGMPPGNGFIEALIPYFQRQYKLLLPGQKNYLLGLSTGARGVALLSLDCPKIFVKAAGLSGDYDQTQMPNDNLMKGFYGPYTDFKDRWTGKDNAVYRFKELQVPIYLGHGESRSGGSLQANPAVRRFVEKIQTGYGNSSHQGKIRTYLRLLELGSG